jgi:AraC-like DNA-binding protein
MHPAPAPSKVLACLGDDGWQCDDVRVAQLAAARPLRFGPGAGGLTFHWIEGAPCIVASAGGAEMLVQPGSLVAVPGPHAYTLRMAGGAARGWALSARWPSSPWLQAMLLDEGRTFARQTSASSLPQALGLLRSHVIDNQGKGAPDAVASAAARALAAWVFAAIESDSHAGRLSNALADARLGAWLGRALLAVGPLPGLDAHAQACHLSRAAFTRRFHELMDLAPTDFLVCWRMNLALHRLSLAGEAVSDLAERFGYRSEPAFRKAFRRATGITPGAARATQSLDAVFGEGPVVPAGSPDDAARLRERAAPRITISTHDGPPELAALLGAVISNL